MRTTGEILKQVASGWSGQYDTKEWAQFSRAIRNSRQNACECCRQSGIELHVHHVFYEPGKSLWEHSPEDLKVLCRPCHKALTEGLRDFRRYVFGHMTPQTIKVLNGVLLVGMTQYNALDFVHALAEFVSNPSLVKRYAASFKQANPQQP